MATLLVIDDDSAVLEVFRRLFQEPDLKVYTALTAEEGMSLAMSLIPM